MPFLMNLESVQREINHVKDQKSALNLADAKIFNEMDKMILSRFYNALIQKLEACAQRYEREALMDIEVNEPMIVKP
jgi:hypothetical protein